MSLEEPRDELHRNDEQVRIYVLKYPEPAFTLEERWSVVER